MKMTDVITGVREDLPRLVDSMERASSILSTAQRLAYDADRCGTEEARKVLVRELYIKVLETANAFGDAMSASRSVRDTVAAYTREFKTADDPRQLELPLTDPAGDASAELNEPSIGDMEEVSNG